jgi:hypothetical protein
MCDLQLMGIDTKDLSLDQIDAAIKSTIGKDIMIRVVKRKDGKGNNFYIAGLAAEADDQDFSSPEDTEGDSADVDDTTDEWSEELEEAAAEEADDTADAAEAEFAPSDWVNFDVQYKAPKTPKPLEFKVVDADDDKGTVTLERQGKKLKNVPFKDLILP